MSIVLVARNEETYIGSCIQSVLEAVKGLNAEVVLVDSASQDRTVKIARGWGVRVWSIPAGAEPSAALGCSLGARNCSGRYIQFLDGDMTIDSAWLQTALDYMRAAEPLVAAVAGEIRQTRTANPYREYRRRNLARMTRTREPRELKSLYGAFMIRADVLREVGSFNPSLKANEEGELSDRIRAAGYRIMLLPHFACLHHVTGQEDLLRTLRRELRGYVMAGQFVRMSFRNGSCLFRLWQFKYCLPGAVRRKDYGHSFGVVFPVFMPYLATAVRRQGWRLEVVDGQALRLDLDRVLQAVLVRRPDFRDQVFTANQERVGRICDLVLSRGLDVQWLFETRVDQVSKSLLMKVRRAGCNRIHYGIETGDEELLRSVGKPKVSKQEAIEAFRHTAELGIRTVAHVIVGLPGETMQTLDNTSWNFATPYPGTLLFEDARRKGLLLTRDWTKYSTNQVVMRTEELSGRKLSEVVQRFARRDRTRKVLKRMKRAFYNEKDREYVIRRSLARLAGVMRG